MSNWFVSPKEGARLILDKYSEVTLLDYFESFAWGGASHEESLSTRLQLYANVEDATSWSPEETVSYFNRIKMWGFNNAEIDSGLVSDQSFVDAAVSLLHGWLPTSNSAALRSQSLLDLMQFPKMGIATVSKFTAMVDPQYAAIYDSRVSLALRDLESNGKRLFPTVGRRSTAQKKYPAADYITAKKDKKDLVEFYLWYLDVLSEVTDLTHFSKNSDVEMALFMIGA